MWIFRSRLTNECGNLLFRNLQINIFQGMEAAVVQIHIFTSILPIILLAAEIFGSTTNLCEFLSN